MAVSPGREATANFPLRRLGAIAVRVVAVDPGMRRDQVGLRAGTEPRRSADCRPGITRSRSTALQTAPGLAWRWGYAALVALEPGAELAGIVFEVSP